MRNSGRSTKSWLNDGLPHCYRGSAIHEDQIARYGGSAGMRDRGLLEAALYRPQTGYYADLIEEAAALWESLAQNHPFIDGNT